jgi:hypothetical protein
MMGGDMRENLFRARFGWYSGVFFIGVLSMTASGQMLRQITKFDLPGPAGKRFDYLTIDNDDRYLLSATSLLARLTSLIWRRTRLSPQLPILPELKAWNTSLS